MAIIALALLYFSHCSSQRGQYGYNPCTLSLTSTKPIPAKEPSRTPRRHPCFPGALPVNSADIQTLIRQTNQENPANAVLGKPATCRCAHGFPQAFSLDPTSQNRLNSGLLKLTCPLLVNSIDSLEDDGFIDEINSMLRNESDITSDTESSLRLTASVNEAHAIHAKSRLDLLSKDAIERLETKLGKQGKDYFMKAGVAGTNPSAENSDIKCLHAWMADSLFRSSTINHHPIGQLIEYALLKRGISTKGTDNCHVVCSGANSSVTSQDGSVVYVPIPRNKQRKKTVKETGRRRRIKHKD